MYYIFLLLPLPALLGIAYYFNVKKLNDSPLIILFVSLFEGITAYLLVTALFLEGFFPALFFVILIFFFFLIFAALSLFNKKNSYYDLDVQIETVKNTIVLFTSTFLLFYVLLTIFRFWHPALQLSIALILTIGFNLGLYYLKPLLVLKYDQMNLKNMYTVNFLAIKSFFLITGTLIIIVFFNFPTSTLDDVFNLEHHSSYFDFKDVPVTVTNRYDSNKLFELTIDDEVPGKIYTNNTADYIFVSYGFDVAIYDIDEESIIYNDVKSSLINNITVPLLNQEENEIEIVPDCEIISECFENELKYEYGDMVYWNYESLLQYNNLTFEHTDTAIFDEDSMILFDDDQSDSFFKPTIKKSFYEYSGYKQEIVDIDYYNGKLMYLKVTSKGDTTILEVFEIVEREIGIEFPFYTYFSYGTLVVILLFALVPITNYEEFTQEISFKSQVIDKENTNK